MAFESAIEPPGRPAAVPEGVPNGVHRPQTSHLREQLRTVGPLDEKLRLHDGRQAGRLRYGGVLGQALCVGEDGLSRWQPRIRVDSDRGAPGKFYVYIVTAIHCCRGGRGGRAGGVAVNTALALFALASCCVLRCAFASRGGTNVGGCLRHTAVASVRGRPGLARVWITPGDYAPQSQQCDYMLFAHSELQPGTSHTFHRV